MKNLSCASWETVDLVLIYSACDAIDRPPSDASNDSTPFGNQTMTQPPLSRALSHEAPSDILWQLIRALQENYQYVKDLPLSIYLLCTTMNW